MWKLVWRVSISQFKFVSNDITTGETEIFIQEKKNWELIGLNLHGSKWKFGLSIISHKITTLAESGLTGNSWQSCMEMSMSVTESDCTLYCSLLGYKTKKKKYNWKKKRKNNCTIKRKPISLLSNHLEISQQTMDQSFLFAVMLNIWRKFSWLWLVWNL